MRKILIIFILMISFLHVNASSLFEEKSSVIYCWNWTSECSLDEWTKIVKNNIDWINTNQSFVDFVQDIVAYILTFISLIAVLYIIYAWFSILVSWWNDEVQKKQKKTIFSIIIWIVLIWLSYTIVNFIVDLAQQGWTN